MARAISRRVRVHAGIGRASQGCVDLWAWDGLFRELGSEAGGRRGRIRRFVVMMRAWDTRGSLVVRSEGRGERAP